MAKSQRKQKKPVEKPAQLFQPKDFLDRIAPAAVKFNTDSYVLGGLYRCVLALRGYPAVTEELALLSHICNRAGVTLHLYARQVTAAEEDAIYHKAVNKNRLDRSSQDNLKRSVTAEANLQDVAAIIAGARKNREPLIHCAVFLELAAQTPEELRLLRDEVGAELTRAKLSADPLLLRQREGFLSANPAGRNALGAQFERVLPASSTANLYPINYSGRSDPHGFYIGNDHYGSDILLDLDRRTPDKTNSSVLILGNSGEGKSYLLKLLICNLLESGKTVICLDPEQELAWLCGRLGGCYADLMGGQFRINFLEAKRWDVGDDRDDDPTVPNAFRQQSPLSQHISFLKDFFRAYKPFTHQQVDTLELMLERLYRKWGISDKTNFSAMGPEDWPIAEDLYAVLEDAYRQAQALLAPETKLLSTSRESLIDQMRDALLSRELSVGDTVLFAATEPYGGPGDFALRGGVIQSIDPERKTCSVQGRFFPMDDVPLHYVLGSYDRSVSEEHYGFPHIRPLLGEHPELAERYLREAEARWNTLCGQPAVSSEVPKNTMQAMGGMS